MKLGYCFNAFLLSFYFFLFSAEEESKSFLECDHQYIGVIHNNSIAQFNIQIPLANFLVLNETRFFRERFSADLKEYDVLLHELETNQFQKIRKLIDNQKFDYSSSKDMQSEASEMYESNIRNKRGKGFRLFKSAKYKLRKFFLKTVAYSAPIAFSIGFGYATPHVVQLIYEMSEFASAENDSFVIISQETVYQNILDVAKMKLEDLKSVVSGRGFEDVEFIETFIKKNHIGMFQIVSCEIKAETIILMVRAKFFDQKGQYCEQQFEGRLSEDTYYFLASSSTVGGIHVKDCEKTNFVTRFCYPTNYSKWRQEMKSFPVLDCLKRETMHHMLFVTKATEYKQDGITQPFPEHGVLVVDMSNGGEIDVPNCPKQTFFTTEVQLPPSDNSTQEMKEKLERMQKTQARRDSNKNVILNWILRVLLLILGFIVGICILSVCVCCIWKCFCLSL